MPLTAEVHFAAVRLITPTGVELYNAIRLRRAIELLNGPRDGIHQTFETLASEFPGMAPKDVTRHILAAQRCIAHDVEF
jgi:hypothetical protein